MSNLPTPTQKVSPCTLTGPLVQDRNNQCEMRKVLMYVWIFNKVFELDQMSSMSKVVLYLTLQLHQTHSCHLFRDYGIILNLAGSSKILIKFAGISSRC